MSASRPVIAIVGRPNVGKSTLFNRLIGRRAAIVQDIPGVTRDRHYGDGELFGQHFLVIDTGGFEPETDDMMLQAMRRQAEIAIDEADAIIALFDGPAGLLPSDEEIARMLQRTNKPVFYAVNKIDGAKHDPLVAEFYALGEELYPISALHAGGVYDLMEPLLEALPPGPDEHEERPDAEIRIAVVGKPNAGKSTLVNRLLREDRLLTSSIPGTTRDSIDTWLELPPDPKALAAAQARLATLEAADEEVIPTADELPIALGDELDWEAIAEEAERDPDALVDAEAAVERAKKPRKYLLIDTAGIRRRKWVKTQLERYSIVRAFKAIDRADVCLLVIDATQGVTEQDAKLAGLIQTKGRACIILVNKWDAVADKDTNTAGEYVKGLRHDLAFIRYAPIIFISALSGQRTHRIMAEVERVYANYQRRVTTGAFNRFLRELLQNKQPPIAKGKRLKIYYGSQVATEPPTYLLNVNYKDAVHFSYERFVLNQIREQWDYEGTPVKLVLRERKQTRRRT